MAELHAACVRAPQTSLAGAQPCPRPRPREMHCVSNMPHSHLGSSGNTLRLLQRQLQHLRAHDLLWGCGYACILSHLQDMVCLLQAQLVLGLPFASRT